MPLRFPGIRRINQGPDKAGGRGLVEDGYPENRTCGSSSHMSARSLGSSGARAPGGFK